MEAKTGESAATLAAKVLTHFPALLVVDEIGYLPVSQDGAILFFQLVNARQERVPTVTDVEQGLSRTGAGCSATR